MPRQKLLRKVLNPPRVKGFAPVGEESHGTPVLMGFEEYEAIRLCDFDGCHHAEAARIMNVSRPTFARIYDEARRKVARAFVTAVPLIFEGSRIYYDSEWYRCEKCRCRFNHLEKAEGPSRCALCGSGEIAPVEEALRQEEPGHRCICRACGAEKEVPYGMPCNQVVCDECGSRMVRKGRRAGWE